MAFPVLEVLDLIEQDPKPLALGERDEPEVALPGVPKRRSRSSPSGSTPKRKLWRRRNRCWIGLWCKPIDGKLEPGTALVAVGSGTGALDDGGRRREIIHE